MNGLLAITYAFMLSFCPYHNIDFGTESERHDNPTHASFQLGLELFDCIDVFAGEDTYQVANNNILSWTPYSQSYWVGAEYHKCITQSFNVKAGVMHKCQHPITSWQGSLSSYDFCVTELYVGVEGKFDIF